MSSSITRRRCRLALFAAMLWLSQQAVAASETADAAPLPDPLPILLDGGDTSALAAAAREAGIAPGSKSRDPESAMQRFAQALVRLRAQLAQTRASGAALPADVGDAVRAADLLVDAEFERLAKTPNGATTASRLADGRARWRTQVDPVLALLDDIDSADAGARAAPVARLLELLETRNVVQPPAIYGAGTLPQHRPRLLVREPRMTPNVAPSYAAGVDTAPLPEDYAAGAEATFSPAILEQAQSLGNDYIAISDFVRTQIRTQWYAGAQKGAEETLRTRAGNDVDQASLLIALLRASRAAARYVTGVVEVPVEPLAAQLGVGTAQVGAALAAAGIPHAPVIAQGRIAAFRLEHVWVAAHVPYEHYRGSSADDHRRTWIPLMPALKPAEFVPAEPVLAPAALDVDLWVEHMLSQPAETLPWKALRDELGFRLSQLQPPLDLATRQSRHMSSATPLNLLPASAPYAVRAVNLESAELLDEQRQWLRLVLRSGTDPDAPVALQAQWPMSEVGLRRIALGYIAATVEDQHLANARGGLSRTPAYLVRVRPSLWIDGRPALAGEGVFDMGTAHRLELQVSGPAGEASAEQVLVAGGVAALALDPQGDAPRTLQDDTATRSDPEAARVLGHFALRYAHEWSQADAQIGATLGSTPIRPLPGATLLIAQYRVDEVLGLPHRLDFQGVALDALLRPVEPIAQRGDAALEAEWLRASALHGSALEHALFEQQWGVRSVSADAGLQQASAAGVPRLTLHNGDDVHALLPSLDAVVRNDVQAWLERGFDIDIVSQPLAIDAWRGSAWRVVDPVSGETGYFISGGYAGGATVVPPELWTFPSLAALFENPYGGEPNTNPLAGFLVQLDESAQGQLGKAGQPLDQRLVALVSDELGRPVQGAQVNFVVREGGGTIDGAPSAQATTDVNGLAYVSLTLAERQEGYGVYVLEEGKEFPQWVSQNSVEVIVETDAAPLVADMPYVAYTLPADPAAVRLTDYSGGQKLAPGLSYVGVTVDVVDAFDNSISNQAVSIGVSDTMPTPECSNHGLQHAPRSALFLPGACPLYLPQYGREDCVVPSLDVVTRPGGTDFNLAPTAAMAATIRLDASGDAGSTSLELLTDGEAVAELGPGQPCNNIYWQSVVQSVYSLRGGEGTYKGGDRSMEVARPETMFPLPRTFYVVQGFGQGWINWEGFYPDERTRITLEGATVVGTRETENGAEYDMLAGERGHVTGTISVPVSWRPGEPQIVSVPPAWVIDLPAPMLEPERIVLSPFQRTRGEFTITAGFVPSDYVTRDTTIELLADGEVDASCSQIFVDGTFRCNFGRGRAFDPEKDYSARYSINHDTPFHHESESVDLTFSRGIIAGFGVDTSNQLRPLVDGYPKRLDIEHEIDIASGWQCPASARFLYSVGQRARITLSFYALDEHGERGALAWQPVDNELQDAGIFEIEIGSNDLRFGEYEYELRAVAESDGEEEVHEGRARNTLKRRDALPLAHSFVKGVDLSSGHAIVAAEDASVGGRGPGLKFTRTYASHGGDALGYLGRGWHSDLDSQVIADRCGSYTVTGAAGQGQRFVPDGTLPDGSITYRALHGYHGTLIAVAGDAFEFIAKDGTRYRFGEPDPAGPRISSIDDTNGNRVTYEYDDNTLPRQVKRISDGAGRSLEMVYEHVVLSEGDPDSDFEFRLTRQLLTRVIGPLGLRIEYHYDADANLVRVTRDLPGASGGRRDEYGYVNRGGLWLVDPSGEHRYYHFGFRLDRARNGLDGSEKRFEYALGWSGIDGDDGPIYLPQQDVHKVIEPDGGETTFAYVGPRGLGPVVTTVTDARNHPTVHTLNRYGAAERVVAPIGRTETVWNMQVLQPASVTDALGTVTAYDYDTQGNKISETVTHASGTLARSWEYHPPTAFDRPIKDRVKTYTDARGIQTTTSWDARGNLAGTSRGGVTEAFGVAGNGDRISRTDGNGDLTQFRYDAYGHVSEEFDTLGVRSASRFDALGRKLSSTDGNGNTTSFDYDAQDRVTAVRHPETDLGIGGGAAVGVRRTEYRDALRRRIETDENGRITVYQHDAMGRVTGIQNAFGHSRSIDYDKNGNKTLETDFRGNPTSFVYDPGNRMTERHEPLGRSTLFTHDDLGNVLSETTAERITEYRYEHPSNLRTHVRRHLDGDVLETVTHFDPNGNPDLSTDARGHATEREFDQRDRVKTLTEPEGRVTTYVYDGVDRKREETVSGPGIVARTRTWTYDLRGHETARKDALGYTWSTAWDGAGNAIRRTDPRGGVVSYGYDARNRQISETGPVAGRVLRSGYDAVGNRIAEEHANGRRIEHLYDRLNRLELSKDLAGGFDPPVFVEFGYDEDGNKTFVADANREATTFEVDALNRVFAEHRPLGRNLAWTHTIHGEIETETDALGRITTHTIDAVGRRTSTTSPAPFSYRTDFGYDENGNLVSQTDARRLETTYVFDALNRRTTQTDPLVDGATYVQRWDYDAVGNVLGHTDRRSIATTTTYDAENRPLQQHRDGVRQWTRSYDRGGNLQTETDANGHTTSHVYNAANEKTSTQRPGNVTDTWAYLPWGDVETATDADGIATSYGYDLRRRRIREVRPHASGDAITTWEYDGVGNRTATIRPEGGQRWSFDYDAANRLEAVTSPEGARTEYDYDAADRRTGIEDAEHRRTDTDYDALGRPTRIEYADGTFETIDEYDGNGNALVRTDANGRVRTDVYDALNRRTQRAWDGDALPRDIVAETAAYDGNGHVLSVAQNEDGGTVHRTTRIWDRQDRLREETDRWNLSLVAEYDAKGNRNARVDADGRTVFQHDRLDRLLALQPGGEGAIALEYTPAGRLASQTHPNGASATFEYDASGRIDTIVHRQNGTDVVRFVYRYDKNGNRIEEQRIDAAGTRTTAYTYDDDDRLTGTAETAPDGSVTTTAYTLDDVGNRKTELVTRAGTPLANRSYQYNARHQLETVTDGVANATTTYDYDNNGNLVQEQTGAQITTYRINPQDRIATLTAPSMPPVDYAYDSDGRRVEKRNSVEAVRYGWDGQSLRHETNVANNPLASYDWAAGRVLRTRRSGTTSYAQHDALKSPIRWSRADGGELASNTYDAWGKTTQQSGTPPPIGYTGYYADAESSLLYAQQRYYAPHLGRFTRIDPWDGDTLNPITLNKYLYGNGNPLSFIDPNGMYGIFFDGTNNRADDPAFGYHTNVWKLHNLYRGGVPKYYHGVGTDDSDALVLNGNYIPKAVSGSGFGKGVSARIEKAYDDVVKYYNSKGAQDMRANDPERWEREGQIDLFGFSRGSATAREFANVLKERGIPDYGRPIYGPPTAGSIGTCAGGFCMTLNPGEVVGYENFAPKVRFMGIYDTVDARGYPPTSPLRDRIKVDPNFVRNTTHITAGNEYRSSFDLTSALPFPGANVPNIKERMLPGTHSGVGGSHALVESQWASMAGGKVLRFAGIDKYSLQLMVEEARLAGVDMSSPGFFDRSFLDIDNMSEADLVPYIHDSRTYIETGWPDWIRDRRERTIYYGDGTVEELTEAQLNQRRRRDVGAIERVREARNGKADGVADAE